MTPTPTERPQRSAGLRDLAVTVGAVALLFTVGAWTGAFARLGASLHRSPYLGEVLGAAVLLLAASAILTRRREHEARREEVLRLGAEARFRALVEESPAIVYTWDAANHVHTYVSPQVTAILGYTPEEWGSGEVWQSAIHPDDQDEVRRRSAEADERGEAHFHAEYRVLTRSGRIAWVRDESRNVQVDAHGRPVLAQGVIYDITAQREADARALEAETRFRTLVEQVPAVSYVWDSSLALGEAPVTYISPQVENLLGYTAEDWLASPDGWAKALDPEDLAPTLAAWKHALSEAAPFAAEYRIRRADGVTVWLRDEANPVGDAAAGRPVYQGVMYDVTERRAAEARLREAEERWRLLLEHLPVTAYMIEYETDDQETIVDRWVGPGITALLGATQEEWLADDDAWSHALHPEDRERVLDAWHAAETTGGRFEAEYRMLHRDGGVVWIHEEAAKVARDGRIRAEGVFMDITARREAETALHLAEDRFRALVEQLPVAVYTDAVDDVSTALYISPRYEELTGYTAEERLRDPELWVRMLHPEDREWVLATSARTNADGSDFDVEYRITRADGTTAWLRDHAVLVEGAGGQRIWQGVLQDVTGQHLAADVLARRDRILQATGLAAERFLQAEAWRDVVDEVLEHLGEAGGATRAYVFENGIDERGATAMLTHVWGAAGYEIEATHPARRRFRWLRRLPRWAAILGSGQVLHGPVSALPEDERAVVELLQVRSLLVVPIVVNGAWWGSVGLDQCDEDRVWHETEIEALTVTANTLAAAIGRGLAAALLAESERRFQTLVEQTPAVTYLDEFDPAEGGAWTTVYLSPKAADLFGTPMEVWDNGGSSMWTTLVHPDDLDRAQAADRRHVSTGEPLDIELRIVRPDGEIRWVRDQAVIVRDTDGSSRFSQGIMFDVTERRASEEALREAEERYRGIVEHVPAAIYLDKADASMESVYMSPQIEQIAGVSAEEWLADPELWLQMMDPEDREQVRASYVRAARAHIPWQGEYRLRTPDGRAIWIHDETTFLHDEHGEARYLQGVFMDVTERKLAEQALRESEQREREAAERLRALDDMKNTFLAAVSHELRSPLTSILGLSLTLERAPEIPEEDRYDLLERLAANARKLDRLLRDLLDIDRLNRGIVAPQRRDVDVGQIARRTVESLDPLAGRDVVVEAAPVRLEVDPAKVERIIENLLMNAARHTSADRRIWLRVQPVDGGALVIVEDNGPGVPEELRDAIFEPFLQGPTASPHAPGTGIGLSLVARFAELHGGHAWVEEREGGGASFRVFLPAGDGAASDTSEKLDAGMPTASR